MCLNPFDSFCVFILKEKDNTDSTASLSVLWDNPIVLAQESNTIVGMQEIETLEHEIDIKPISKTLVHGYGENYSLDYLTNKIIEIDPS